MTNRLKPLKKVVDKVVHGKLRTNIPSAMAAAGPPLGPMLGQVNRYIYIIRIKLIQLNLSFCQLFCDIID